MDYKHFRFSTKLISQNKARRRKGKLAGWNSEAELTLLLGAEILNSGDPVDQSDLDQKKHYFNPISSY